jgi:transposase-like protein
MERTAEDLRIELRRVARKRKRGARYPLALQREVAAFAQAGAGRGESQSEMARRLGISQPTLRRWMVSLRQRCVNGR